MKQDLTQPTQSISARELPIEPVELVAVSGPGKGARHALSSGMAIAGASRSCDLHVEDPSASRKHASFELLHGAVRVRDLGSRNGTHWLGGRVENVIVPIGTRLTLGRTEVQVRSLAVAATPAERTELPGLVTESQAMQALVTRLVRVAATAATVVLVGPTGSGKEAVARAVHARSGRAGPFEVFDAASAGEQLLESELFGHRRGAFTGATADHEGVIERSHAGTLLLDNVDQLPLASQTRLLRFLEERTVRRLGDAAERQVDVRVIATAQVPLEDAVKAGRLRADLFYRLAEVVLEVPGLQHRLEDVVPLARCFAREGSGLDVELSPATLAALQAHLWPGNVRELKNAVVRAVALGSFEQQELEPRKSGEPAPRSDLKKARGRVLEAFEADFLKALLQKHRWNVAAAARDAKLARSHFYTLMRAHGIERD